VSPGPRGFTGVALILSSAIGHSELDRIRAGRSRLHGPASAAAPYARPVPAPVRSSRRQPDRPRPPCPQDRPGARRDLPRREASSTSTTPSSCSWSPCCRADHRQAGQRRQADAVRGLPRRAAMAAADRENLEQIIGPLGFFRAKTESLLKLSPALVERYDGEVPPRSRTWSRCPASAARPPTSCSATRSASPASPSTPTSAGSPAGSAGPRRPTRSRSSTPSARCSPSATGRCCRHHLIWHGRRICHARKPACGACPVARWCPSYGEGPTDPVEPPSWCAPRAAREARLLAAASPRPWWAARRLQRRRDRSRPPGAPRPRRRRRHPRPARAQGRRPASSPASRAPAPRHGRPPRRHAALPGRRPTSTWPSLRGPLVLNLWAAGAGPAARRCRRYQDFHEQYGDRCRHRHRLPTTPSRSAALELARAQSASPTRSSPTRAVT
jgi:hypothetical protein